ncbi:biogenesis of lysosome-related organelles complex 1 subunit 1-like [Dromiciops gliroides]|uniref:biogenesis of lysosome-related organelles complex 1 subunit 1-like n=1 Tax=Dromiciops gliroides TaxID=33562 RepID=UPI001CC7C911|nr:biogenesis of lysosome-related organelles complex 1 subunit 1-like [Dromiciops gliroides]
MRQRPLPPKLASSDPGPAMLSLLLKEQKRSRTSCRRRREAITATCLTEALGDPLNVGVARAYVNQKKLDYKVKILQVQVAQFAKQTGPWIGMVEDFNQALGEIGDGENWARSIELDMTTIATTLVYVYKGQLQPAPPPNFPLSPPVCSLGGTVTELSDPSSVPTYSQLTRGREGQQDPQ